MSLGEWGQTCLTFFLVLAGFGAICRRGWVGVGGAGLLAVADFVRGFVYRGGGLWPGWCWGSWSVSGPLPVLWLLAVLYCLWGLYPFVLVGWGAALRTYVGCASVIVLASLVAAVVPVEPPWMGGAVRSVSVVPVLRDLVAADVSPAAAFPSVHVAIPLVVACCQRSWAWAACALVTSVVVVLSGEHWMVDVVGGVGAALVVVGGVAICGGSRVICTVGGALRSGSWVRFGGGVRGDG